jgi:NADH-quinone oxidoreductase subunit J
LPLFADIAEPLDLLVLVPLFAGALAVWYLLPTPQRRPAAPGGLIGLIALAGLGAFLIKGFGKAIPTPSSLSADQIVEAVLFFGFGGLAILFTVLTLASRNPARSAIAFAMVVLSVCGLFLLLAAPFLMATTIIIYAGAIIVTFLFVIMLSNQTGPSNADQRTREPSLSVAAGFILLATFLVGLQRVHNTASVDAVIAESQRLSAVDKLDVLYQSGASPDSIRQDADLQLSTRAKAYIADARAALERVSIAAPRSKDDPRLTEHQTVRDVENAIAGLEVLGFRFNDADDVKTNARRIADGLTRLKSLREIAAKPNDVVLSPHGEAIPVGDSGEVAGPRTLPSANVTAIGRTLFSDHLLAVELAGTLLLIATIGAIAIASRSRAPREARS